MLFWMTDEGHDGALSLRWRGYLAAIHSPASTCASPSVLFVAGRRSALFTRAGTRCPSSASACWHDGF